MTCSPSQTACLPAESNGRDRLLHRAERLLGDHGARVDDVPGAQGADAVARQAALATALMDLYRRTASSEVFESLVEVAAPQLYARVRSRLRCLGAQFDPHEVLQDTLVNVYRYPDRFDASRPGAFAAWSSTIVDNVIRRLLRRRTSGVEVVCSPNEILMQQADRQTPAPDRQVSDQEEAGVTARAFSVLLLAYLHAFRKLSERERFVLQMVEVRQMRYAELAERLSIRPEALKMVVFRARKRVFDHLGQMLAPSAS